MKAHEKKRLIWSSVILIGLGIAYILYWTLYASHYEDTNDAFIEGHPVPISARVSGHVQEIFIDDNQNLTAGQVVVGLDPRDFETALAQAKGNLAAAEAEAYKSELDWKRYQILRRKNDVSQQTLDHAEALAKSDLAQVVQARAEVRQAELNLSYTRIHVPHAGWVTAKSVEPGAYIKAGQPLFYLVKPELWVIANFKEDQITRMKPGQEVTIHIDAFPGKKFKGTLDSIQRGSGAAFSLFPPENATGNYVKVVQRIPVKILFNEIPDPSRFTLGPGLSVEPKVKVK